MRLVAAVVIVSIFAFVGGCASTKMKPRPVIYGPGRADPCADIPESKRTNHVEVFYATNRVPKGPTHDRRYTNGVDDRVHLGVAKVRIGDKDTTWDDVRRASLGGGSNLRFRYERATELGRLDSGASDDSADAFVDAINRQLDSSDNREVSVYVHGFRTKIELETELLAKLAHFTRRGGAMVCFAWPSRQSLLLYGPDVKRAKQSAHHLADLIELIASRTDADRINVLGYSAGAAAAADALCRLRDRYPDDDADALSKRLRIGNVIFAASDIDLKVFARDQFNRIQDVGQNTIIYVASNDAALGIASLGYGASRLGRPNVAKLNLSKAQIEQAAKDGSAQVVDVTHIPGPGAAGGRSGGFSGHGYWYANDWVLTDLLVVLRWQIRADERGLVRKPGTARWVFPKDYPKRVYDAVRQLASPTTAPTTLPTTAPTTTTAS